MNRTDQFLMSGDREPVGHAGDEVADRAQPLGLAPVERPSFGQPGFVPPVLWNTRL